MSIESQTRTSLFNLLKQLKEQSAALPAEVNTGLTELNATAKQIGLGLYALGSYDKARFHLTIAGAAGDVESQYAMATCETRLDGGFRLVSEATAKWLRLAAAQDHIPALLRLGDSESLARARTLATTPPLADTPSAQRYLYTLTNDVQWLKKAADQGDIAAMYELKDAYAKRPELVPNRLEREALIVELTQRAADRGYPKAVYELAFTTDEAVSVEEKQKRIIQLAMMGQLDGLLEYAYALAGLSQDKNRVHRTYGLERNLPKACALLKLVLTKVDGALPLPSVEDDYQAIKHQMQDTAERDIILAQLRGTITRVFQVLEPLVILGW